MKLNDEQIVSSLVVLMTEMLTVKLDDLKKKLKKDDNQNIASLPGLLKKKLKVHFEHLQAD